MKKLFVASLMAALCADLSSQAVAQTPSGEAAPTGTAPINAVAVPQKTLVLPANSEVILRLTDELTSKGNQNKVGSMFRLTVAYDVKVDGTTVIPSGTPAVGEITKRTGKGVFGKSGKLEVELRQVDLNGQRIPLNGKYRQEGEGNTMAAVGAVFLSAPLLFVTGKSAVIPRGRELSGYTTATTTIVVQ